MVNSHIASVFVDLHPVNGSDQSFLNIDGLQCFEHIVDLLGGLFKFARSILCKYMVF